eukprot:16249381-Heterocapsa_arctica.AAC.1
MQHERCWSARSILLPPPPPHTNNSGRSSRSDENWACRKLGQKGLVDAFIGEGEFKKRLQGSN